MCGDVLGTAGIAVAVATGVRVRRPRSGSVVPGRQRFVALFRKVYTCPSPYAVGFGGCSRGGGGGTRLGYQAHNSFPLRPMKAGFHTFILIHGVMFSSA
jgi:hypothetical protein